MVESYLPLFYWGFLSFGVVLQQYAVLYGKWENQENESRENADIGFEVVECCE